MMDEVMVSLTCDTTGYILIQEGILATLGCARKRAVRLQVD